MSTESQVIYGPRRGRRWRACLLMLVLGGAMAAQEWLRTHQRVPVGAGTPTGNPVRELAAGFLVVVGLGLLTSIVRGLPRLTVDRHGLVMRSLFRSKAADWDSLGAFAVVVAGEGRRGEKLIKAVAPVIGAGPGPARRSFTIPDAFEVPLATVLRDITQRHGGDGAAAPQLEPVPEPARGVSGFRWPWLTAALLAAFVGVFLLEQRFALAPAGPSTSPSVATLVALGGLNRTLVQSGQWYRLLSAPFLHAGWPHLLANGLAFALAGYSLEWLVGRAWMFCIFAFGALAGSMVSMAVTAPVVSVGASGAIMAMLVALFMTSFRLPASRAKIRIQVQSFRVAIPALIPVSQGAAAMHVDYGAHFGGALVGAVLGALLLRTWRAASPLPGFRTGAAALAALAVLAFAVSAYAVAGRYPFYAATSHMIPAAEYPHGQAETASRAEALLAEYPLDPRSHVLAAVGRLQREDKAGGEQELRTALALAEASPWAFLMPALTNSIRAALAETLLAEDRKPEASAIAHDACVAQDASTPTAQVAAKLVQSGLCGPVPAH